MDRLPEEHKPSGSPAPRLTAAEQSMASVMLHRISRLNEFLLTSEPSRVLHFDTAPWTLRACRKKSLPSSDIEEGFNNFNGVNMIQTLSRELFPVA